MDGKSGSGMNLLGKLGWLAAALLLLAREGVAAGLAAWVWKITGPFFIGGLLAFLLSIPMGAVEQNLPATVAKGRQMLALIITLLGLLAALLLAGFLVAPQLMESGRALAQSVPQLWERIGEWLELQMENWPWLTQIPLPDISQLSETLLETVGGGTVSGLSGMMGGITDFGLGLVFACYILLHRKTLHRQGVQLAMAWLPREKAKDLFRLLRLVGESFRIFFGVQCLEAVILACMLAAAMFICRLPNIALICVVVGITAIIPIFGSFIGAGVGIFITLAQQPEKTLWFLVIFLAVQQIEGSFVYPKVVGNSVGLPPIWVLAAVTLGGRLFGVTGMILMIPVFRVLYTVLGELTHRRLDQNS